MSEEYQAARQYAVDLRQQSADMQKLSDWNAYLHRHKGQGWTQARLLVMYMHAATAIST